MNRNERQERKVLLIALPLLLIFPASVRAQTPAFSKSFIPGTIGPGSVSTLRFTIANSTAAFVSGLSFTDSLPTGVAIAVPALASTTCDGTLTTPGGSAISLSGGRVGSFSNCIVSVDVTSATLGTHTNVSGNLTSSFGSSGTASANLTVAADRPGFTKSFTPSSLKFGGRATLTFTINNAANPSAAFNLSFSDNLPSGLTIANPPNASTTCTGGQLTANAGAGVFAYAGAFQGDASVGAFSTCTATVDTIATAIGLLSNTTSELTSTPPTQGAAARSSGRASVTLNVTRDIIVVTKSFTDDPVAPGNTATLEFRITVFDRASGASGIAFTDDLNVTLSGLVATGPFPANPCGSGSQLSGSSVVSLSGGNLDPAGSCAFNFSVKVPASASGGAYTNTTSSIAASVGGTQVVGNPATDTLFVLAAPTLSKSFTNDPVAAGATVSLQFTLTNTSPTQTATSIEFMDNLDSLFPGLTVSNLPATGFCGAGSSLVTSTPPENLTLKMTGGSLSPGASCNFSVSLQVPANAAAGTFINTTTAVQAILGGIAATGKAASDALVVVAAPVLRKSFIGDPVLPGGTVELEFTLTHSESAPAGATGITFSDNLSGVLSGLVATGMLPTSPCGAGSQISGTSLLLFSGGTLAAGESCVFRVTLQIPAGASPGSFVNTTSSVTAMSSGLAVTGDSATGTLTIAALSLSKTFTNDPVVPGGTANLQFKMTNASPVSIATEIAFTDDLSGVLSGLAAVNLPAGNVCGAGSQISGTGLLTFTGGTLAAGASCTVNLTLQIPTGAATGEYTNTTSPVSAKLGSATVSVGGATDSLIVASPLSITKSFTNDPVAPGGTVTLLFMISHSAQAPTDATGITFSDVVNASLSGLMAIGLPPDGFCGTGSRIIGSTILSFTGGRLTRGASCSFNVPLRVPSAAQSGSYTNTTSAIAGSVGGAVITGSAATDNLTVSSAAGSRQFKIFFPLVVKPD